MTQRGIHLCLCCSIQVEGAFGLLKNDVGFRRILTRGKANIRTELFLLALAFGLKKLWMKRRLQTSVSKKMTLQLFALVWNQLSLILRKLPPFCLFQTEENPPQNFSILRRVRTAKYLLDKRKISHRAGGNYSSAGRS